MCCVCVYVCLLVCVCACARVRVHTRGRAFVCGCMYLLVGMQFPQVQARLASVALDVGADGKYRGGGVRCMQSVHITHHLAAVGAESRRGHMAKYTIRLTPARLCNVCTIERE